MGKVLSWGVVGIVSKLKDEDGRKAGWWVRYALIDKVIISI